MVLKHAPSSGNNQIQGQGENVKFATGKVGQ